MKPNRFAFAAVLCGLATSAGAVPTAGSYSFTTPTATTGRTTWLDTSTGYNATNGTDYGNSITFASTGLSVPVTVTATAWASTGGTGGYGGTIEQAYVSRYAKTGSTLNELAITSQPGTGNTAELTYSGSGSNRTAVPNTAASNPEHAIDNAGSYESMMFTFASAVTLNGVSVGFPSSTSGLDSDATVLVYTGAGAPTMTARTYADLVAPGGGWAIAGNLSNLATTGSGTLSSTVASRYWMVGGYMAIGSNGNTMLADGKDYFKVNGLTVTQGLVTPRAVPEPGNAALFGIAGVAMLIRRRRRAEKA